MHLALLLTLAATTPAQHIAAGAAALNHVLDQVQLRCGTPVLDQVQLPYGTPVPHRESPAPQR
jgi:hypothetical protein